ncbi:putative two-component system response regulator [Halobacteriovorax marinus SJ]|uniref:Two-component system response regulator n=1 Tax=Halobacteriovorax marinus (strain ATCC BAA-682 / DSM 15412 / SJ) TaxID=862908 RepID=E1X4B9_HALMS|nr:response regulator [Halobacteriovorax marinus]CBW27091.1 putative two-component system response regulator [Halobacteriovorax marinus SJ]
MIERSNFRVLIVDDEPDILELMEEEFNYYGYQTMTADCGNDAISKLRSHQFDIIVSDYKMPNGNGMAVLDEVNTMAAETRPDFFFVSGQADISIKDAIDAGAKKFFSKPFDLDDLIKEIEKELSSK